MVGVTLFSVWFAGRFLDRRLFSDFGLHLNRGAWWADFAFGLALGIVLVLALVLLGIVTDTVSLEPVFMAGFPDLSFGLAVLLSAVVYLCVGIFEEVGRAYHIRNLLEGTAQRLGLGTAAVIAVIAASVISVMMHSGNPAFLMFVLLATAVKGSSYLLTKRIGIAVGYHAAWDFAMITILGVGAQVGVDGATAFYIMRFSDVTWGSTVNYDELTLPAMLALLGLEFIALLLILGWTRLRYGDIKVRENLTTPTLQR
jgi:membrane protease YdiL (CAAX protease family)